jgi:hypothetical protein
LKALILKYALIKLHKNWLYDDRRAEALIEEIAPIISIRHSPPIEDVGEVTMAIARDYCRICVRKTVEADSDDEKQKYLQAVRKLYDAHMEPYDSTDETNWGVEIDTYLALLHRLNGQVENASSTLRPFIHHCVSTALVMGIYGRDTRAIRALGESLLALDHVKDACDLLHYVHDTRGGSCSSCNNFFRDRENTAMCQHCFEYFCGYCLRDMEEARLTRFCMSGHKLLERKPGPHLDKCSYCGKGWRCDEGDKIVFRGEKTSVDDCLNLIKGEWNLEDVAVTAT